MSPRAGSMEARIVVCPHCQAPIKTSPAVRSKRVQCPKCREIVTLKSETPLAPVASTAPAAEVPNPPAPDAALLERIELLEARLLVLEKIIAAAGPELHRDSKLRWLSKDESADFSAAQEEVLRHNLGMLPAHRIIIQIPIGNQPARTRAEWFKGVFERAQWAVSGPLDAGERAEPGSIAIATGLPVSREAASTFLALRAAGFSPAAIFDPSLEGEERLIVA